MRLSQLRDFVAIVDAGSLRAAARANGVSHPALTKSLRLLEGEVGVALLRRNNRGIACTPAGRALLARARAIQAEVRKAEEDLAHYAGPGGGQVSIGLSSAATMLVADAIARFTLSHAETRLRIMAGPPSVLVPLVRDETLDFAIVVRMPATTGAGLSFRSLHKLRMAVACRRGHPLEAATTLVQLAETRWLGLNAPGAGGWLEQTLSKAGIAFPRRYIQCESFALAAELMARSDAVMAVPLQMIRMQGEHGRLVAIGLDAELPTIELGLCARNDSRSTAAAAALGRLISDVLREARTK